MMNMRKKAEKWKSCGDFDFYAPEWAFGAPWGVAWVLSGFWWFWWVDALRKRGKNRLPLTSRGGGDIVSVCPFFRGVFAGGVFVVWWVHWATRRACQLAVWAGWLDPGGW